MKNYDIIKINTEHIKNAKFRFESVSKNFNNSTDLFKNSYLNNCSDNYNKLWLGK